MSIEHATHGRSARLSHDSITILPADAKLRPLRDQLIVEPLGVVASAIIIVPPSGKPVRGIVKAAGPGCYPKCYDHPDKHKRTKMWDSPVFRPTAVKVGDVVELGGAELGGYSFQTFYWGDRLHLHCREEDVSGVLDGVTAIRTRSLKARVRAFYEANPDEELTFRAVQQKFNCSLRMGRKIVYELVEENELESVHVIRRRERGIAT